jgi:hypothetical protein
MYSVLEKRPSILPNDTESWAVANVICESHAYSKAFAGAGMHHNSVNRLSFHTSVSRYPKLS